MDHEQTTSAWLETPSGLNTPVRGSCFLGRAATNHVVLTDDRASRRHAVVQTQGHGGEFWIVDLGSANGTYLNGRRVTQPCRLTDRDHIELAGQGFTFRQERTGHTLVAEPTTDKTVQDIRSMDCWLLVADMEGSTQTIQKLPAHEVSQITARWLAACKQIGEENLMGSEVNFVFRVEKLASGLGRSCLVSEPAAAALRPHLPLLDEGRHPVASFDGGFQFFGPVEKSL